jgi:hypothetical protein
VGLASELLVLPMREIRLDNQLCEILLACLHRDENRLDTADPNTCSGVKLSSQIAWISSKKKNLPQIMIGFHAGDWVCHDIVWQSCYA